MNERQKLLFARVGLTFSGLMCLGLYPLVVLWPSAWFWGPEGAHYLHMFVIIYAVWGVFLLLAARNPPAYRSLLQFTAWANLGHGGLMAVQALMMPQFVGHLWGDAGGLMLLAVGIWIAMPAATPGAPPAADALPASR